MADYRTHISGIRKQDLEGAATDFKTVRRLASLSLLALTAGV